MPPQIILENLKRIDLSTLYVSLAIVKEYKAKGESRYNVKYVQTNDPLKNKLRNIIKSKIENSNSVEEYNFDCPEPEGDHVRSINYEETNFSKIYEQLKDLNPEEDIIQNVDELVKAKAYLIILRNDDGIQIVGFKTIPENWKMRRSKGLIPLLYNQNEFQDLDDDNIFSISGTLDLIFYNELLFILSKKSFEYGLNFREGMISKANDFYVEVSNLGTFENLEALTTRVGNNQRYLRKIAMINNLGHFRDMNFIQRIIDLNDTKGWNISIQDDRIVFSEESIDVILTLLQNKRLYSEITEQNFDVDSAKLLN